MDYDSDDYDDDSVISKEEPKRKESKPLKELIKHKKEKHHKLPWVAHVILLLQLIYFFFSNFIDHKMNELNLALYDINQKTHTTHLIEQIGGLVICAIIVDSYTGKYYVLLVGAVVYVFIPLSVIPFYFIKGLKFKQICLQIGFHSMALFPILSGARYAFCVDQMAIIQGGHAQETYLFFTAFFHILGQYLEASLSLILDRFHVGLPICFVIAIFATTVHLCGFIAIRKKVVNKAVYLHVVFKLIGCVCYSIWLYCRRDRSEEPEDNILDYARGYYSFSLIESTKRFFRLMPMFFPLLWYGLAKGYLHIIWQHQTQLLSSVSQDHNVVTLAPGFVQLSMVVVLLPTMHFYVVPFLNKHFNFLVTDLQCLCTSYLMLALSITATCIIQYIIDHKSIVLPAAGYGQMRVYNVLGSTSSFYSDWTQNVTLPALEVFVAYIIFVRKFVGSQVIVHNEASNLHCITFISIIEQQSITYLITNHGLESVTYFDPLIEPRMTNDHQIRAYIINGLNRTGLTMVLVDKEGHSISFALGSRLDVVFILIPHQSYTGMVVDKFSNQISDSMHIDPVIRSTYTFLVANDDKPKLRWYFTAQQPMVISVYWMMFQWAFKALALAAGEVALTRFAYSQFPENLRTIICTFILFGNELAGELITLQTYIKHFRSDTYMSLIILSVHFIFLFIFTYLSLHYIYVFNLKRRATVRDFFMLQTLTMR